MNAALIRLTLDRSRPVSLGPQWRGAPAIEYRHSPDPGDIGRIVRPLLAEAAGAGAEEDVA